MRRGSAGAMQWRRRLVGATQSIAGDGGGGGAGKVAFSRAGLVPGVYIGTEVRGGASLLCLGGNALPGAVGIGRPARWRRWRAEGVAWRFFPVSWTRGRTGRSQGVGQVALEGSLGSTWPQSREGDGVRGCF